MSLLTVFTSTFPSISYLFPNGKAAPFVNGVYKTDKADEIAHLNEEIRLGHPHIGVPILEHDRVVDSVQADPMVALKERMRQELIAEMAATNPDRDMGTSEQGKFRIQNTQDLRESIDSGGAATSLSARLAAMRGNQATVTPSQLLDASEKPLAKNSDPEVLLPRSNPPVIVPLDTSNPSHLPSDNPNSEYLNKKE